jgi:hypothetical protein
MRRTDTARRGRMTSTMTSTTTSMMTRTTRRMTRRITEEDEPQVIRRLGDD